MIPDRAAENCTTVADNTKLMTRVVMGLLIAKFMIIIIKTDIASVMFHI
jgi:hypothetical protein